MKNIKNFIKGEIYFITNPNWDYNYIQMYQDKNGYYPYIGIHKKSGGLAFDYSDFPDSCFCAEAGFYQIATEQQKNWLNECIKKDKLVPLKEVKFDGIITNYEIY